jgi:hypothetical protein
MMLRRCGRGHRNLDAGFIREELAYAVVVQCDDRKPESDSLEHLSS